MTNVERVDINEDTQKAKILALLQHAFGTFSADLYDQILRNGPRGSIGYGIYEEDELVAFNGFIGHSVHMGGQTGIAYQSCLTATHKDHGGRGYFSAIIKHAQVDLKKIGGAFIFGFPNHNSGPIFVKKLGFTLSQNTPCFFVKTPIWRKGQLDGQSLLKTLSQDQHVNFDMRETAFWKSAGQDGILEFENLTNYLFGKIIRKKRFGLPFPIFVIGGCEVNKPYQFGTLIQTALAQSGARVARVNANSLGWLTKATKLHRSSTLTEPTIAYSLNWSVDAHQVEAFGGLKDVF